MKNPLLPPRAYPLSASLETTEIPDNLEELKDFTRALLGQMQHITQSYEQLLATATEKGIQQGRIQAFQEILEYQRLERHKKFGASSEKNNPQRGLFDEAETLYAQSTEADEVVVIPPATPSNTTQSPQTAATKKRGKRQALDPELERVERIYELPPEQRQCPCGCTMVEMGEEVSEQLDIIPMQVQVIRHIRKRYGCAHAQHTPVTAELPAQPLPKSNASAGFLSMLLMLKYADGMPLYRIEHSLARHGATVPRQTLARWVIGAANILQPLHNLVRDTLLEQPYIHMDETVVQVLKEKGREPTSKSYMWVQTAGPPDKKVVLFDYDPSRSGEVPSRLLSGYHGMLMTDGYDGYLKVVKDNQLRHLICWAHVRRKFVEAQKAQSKKTKNSKVDEMIALIGQLYGVEKEMQSASVEERLEARQTQSTVILQKIADWVQTHKMNVLPSSLLGTAISYLEKRWDKLQRYIERGDLPIDNNAAENAIRPFVVGRKAWLFSDTPEGAHASAVIYSLMETAKANMLNPYTWFHIVFNEAPNAKTVEDYEKLLPWNFRDSFK